MDCTRSGLFVPVNHAVILLGATAPTLQELCHVRPILGTVRKEDNSHEIIFLPLSTHHPNADFKHAEKIMKNYLQFLTVKPYKTSNDVQDKKDSIKSEYGSIKASDGRKKLKMNYYKPLESSSVKDGAIESSASTSLVANAVNLPCTDTNSVKSDKEKFEEDGIIIIQEGSVNCDKQKPCNLVEIIDLEKEEYRSNNNSEIETKITREVCSTDSNRQPIPTQPVNNRNGTIKSEKSCQISLADLKSVKEDKPNCDKTNLRKEIINIDDDDIIICTNVKDENSISKHDEKKPISLFKNSVEDDIVELSGNEDSSVIMMETDNQMLDVIDLEVSEKDKLEVIELDVSDKEMLDVKGSSRNARMPKHSSKKREETVKTRGKKLSKSMKKKLNFQKRGQLMHSLRNQTKDDLLQSGFMIVDTINLCKTKFKTLKKVEGDNYVLKENTANFRPQMKKSLRATSSNSAPAKETLPPPSAPMWSSTRSPTSYSVNESINCVRSTIITNPSCPNSVQVTLNCENFTRTSTNNISSDTDHLSAYVGSNVCVPDKEPKANEGLRPVVIDACNVAFSHGLNTRFSFKGLEICIKFFKTRGHKVIAILPNCRKCNLDVAIADKWENDGTLVFTPSRKVNGKLIISHDDRYIIQCAAAMGGVIVSKDNFRDFVGRNPLWDETINKRLLMFTWIGDLLMFPEDPLGRNGPTLEQFLRFPPS